MVAAEDDNRFTQAYLRYLSRSTDFGFNVKSISGNDIISGPLSLVIHNFLFTPNNLTNFKKTALMNALF